MPPDDPRHGKYAGYVAGCREACCRKAAADYQRQRYFDRAVLGLPPRHVDKTGTVRRVQALQRIGWSAEHLSERLGRSRAYLNVAVNRDARRGVHRDTATAVAALFSELCMTPGPSEITRKRAERNGWPGPLAWDDIDDPNEHPNLRDNRPARTDVDEAVVLRVMAGERLPMTTGERVEVVARLRARGWSLNEIETRCGISKADRYIGRGTAA